MPTTPTVIDSHVHVFVRGLPLAPQRRHAPEHDATVAALLAEMDAQGVSHAVLVQPSFLGTNNDFLRQALRSQPRRFRGVAVVDPTATPEHLHELAADGVCGIRLNLVGLPLPDLTQPTWQRLLGHVRALDWHVEVHRAAADLAQLGQPILDAGCKLVIDHFGLPGKGELSPWLLGAASSGRTWVKLSAAYRNWPADDAASPRAAAERLLATFGPQHLVWGSDWPHTQHREHADYALARQSITEWVSDPVARAQILADTPRQLFHFNDGDTA